MALNLKKKKKKRTILCVTLHKTDLIKKDLLKHLRHLIFKEIRNPQKTKILKETSQFHYKKRLVPGRWQNLVYMLPDDLDKQTPIFALFLAFVIYVHNVSKVQFKVGLNPANLTTEFYLIISKITLQQILATGQQ